MSRLVLVLCLLLVVPATAQAAPLPESEPNGDLWTANPFIADGVRGEIADENDYDVFRFNLRPGIDGEFTLRHEGGGGCELAVQTLDQEYGDAVELWVSEEARSSSEEWLAEEEDVPAVAIVWGEPGCRYNVSVSPVGLVGPAAPAPQRRQVAEPNEGPEQAWGPMSQGVEHTGVASSFEDSEWMFLYLVPNLVTDIELTSPSPACAATLSLYELDEFGEPSEVLMMEAIGASTSTGFYRSSGNRPTPHFIEVLADEGCAWGVRVPTRLGAGPLPPVGEPIVTLSLRLRALRHSDAQLKRRFGLEASCQVNMASSCQVTAWLPRVAAKRAGIAVSRRKSKVRLGSGRATARKAGQVKVRVRIPARLRKKLIALKGGVKIELAAKATARGQSPAMATSRVGVGS